MQKKKVLKLKKQKSPKRVATKWLVTPILGVIMTPRMAHCAHHPHKLHGMEGREGMVVAKYDQMRALLMLYCQLKRIEIIVEKRATKKAMTSNGAIANVFSEISLTPKSWYQLSVKSEDALIHCAMAQ